MSTRLDGEFAVISIADTGTGIPEDIRSRIFDPFFTTKEVGRGTGQGLAMVHNIVDKHAGKLHVDSSMGRGRRVRDRAAGARLGARGRALIGQSGSLLAKNAAEHSSAMSVTPWSIRVARATSARPYQKLALSTYQNRSKVSVSTVGSRWASCWANAASWLVVSVL